ncbi:hypothetical protein GCM10007981_05610 [Thermocladium modestius]|uniref:Uncharacterized protein n=1 Tax=Thermocladium modestius TaxID=62609 RepID=A0A830GSS6_9CREN|nr:hypothetical protein [Thermocladium modestius]GGP19932.1 hypothetical protein GCM10007981_05610 [Thermocladium modestius]
MYDLIRDEAHDLIMLKTEHLIIKQAIVKYMKTRSTTDLSLLLNLLERHLEKEAGVEFLSLSKEMIDMLGKVKESFVKGTISDECITALFRAFVDHDNELNKLIWELDAKINEEIRRIIQ